MSIEQERLSLREVQLASIDILKVIDGICQREGLRYYLAHGSLLGAVRHHGFIPWDDDLDIAMPRSDYNKLLDYFDAYADDLDPLMALHNTGSRKLPFLITRISDTRYQQLGEFSVDVPEMGVFVDVYPLDGAGETKDEAIAERHSCWKLIMAYLRSGNFASNNRSNGLLKRLLKAVRARAMSSCSTYEEELLHRASMKTFDSTHYVACTTWGIPQILDLVINKEDLGDGIMVPFEDIEARIPIGYDNILTDEYGDYMTLPPENERVGHHFYEIVRRT